MGKGIDLARADAPIHAAVLDDFKDQLLIALVAKLGGDVTIPVADVDETGKSVMLMSIDPDARTFHFKIEAAALDMYKPSVRIVEVSGTAQGAEPTRDAWELESDFEHRLNAWHKEHATLAPQEQAEPSIISEVLAERRRQDEQWGGPAHDDLHDAGDWGAYIRHQLKRLVGVNYAESFARERFIKIAALGMAAAESLTRKADSKGGTA